MRGTGRGREPNCTKADERWCWPRLGWWPHREVGIKWVVRYGSLDFSGDVRPFLIISNGWFLHISTWMSRQASQI